MILHKQIAFFLVLGFAFCSFILCCTPKWAENEEQEALEPMDTFFACEPNSFSFPLNSRLEQIVVSEVPSYAFSVLVTLSEDTRFFYDRIEMPFDSEWITVRQIDDRQYYITIPPIDRKVHYDIHLFALKKEDGTGDISFWSE